MPEFKIYNKLQYRGRSVGHAYLNAIVTAPNQQKAAAIGRQKNYSWRRAVTRNSPATSRAYNAKVVRVVRIR